MPETYGVVMGSGARGPMTGKLENGVMTLEINAVDLATGDRTGTCTRLRPTGAALFPLEVRASLLK